MDNTNHCILTGIVVDKSRNANNKDLKRPILDLEIISTKNNNTLIFSKVPILFSDILLSKFYTGYKIGEILMITGRVQQDKKNGIYIEAETVTKMQEKNTKICSLAVSRSELLQMQQRFNHVYLVGLTSNKRDKLIVKRNPYTKGDLKKEDIIPIYYNIDSEIPCEKQVSCLGELQDNGEEIYISVNRLYIVEEPNEETL